MRTDDPIVETGRTFALDSKLGCFSRGCALTLAFLLMVAALLILLCVIGPGGLASISTVFWVGVAFAMAACAVALTKWSGPL